MANLELKSKNHQKGPQGWEVKQTITETETGDVVASVIYWPWSDASAEQADNLLTKQLRFAGFSWDDVDQGED